MKKDDVSRFSKNVQTVLLEAGWMPGRFAKNEMEIWNRKLTSKEFELFPAARDVLLEFGGLNVVQHGPGDEFAREPFNLDPLIGEYEADFFVSYSKVIGEKLFPLGENIGGYALLAIGESGKIYSLAGGIVWLVGNTIDDALEHLIRGFGIHQLPINL
jgi:hypothetical protein